MGPKQTTLFLLKAAICIFNLVTLSFSETQSAIFLLFLPATVSQSSNKSSTVMLGCMAYSLGRHFLKVGKNIPAFKYICCIMVCCTSVCFCKYLKMQLAALRSRATRFWRKTSTTLSCCPSLPKARGRTSPFLKRVDFQKTSYPIKTLLKRTVQLKSNEVEKFQ